MQILHTHTHTHMLYACTDCFEIYCKMWSKRNKHKSMKPRLNQMVFLNHLMTQGRDVFCSIISWCRMVAEERKCKTQENCVEVHRPSKSQDLSSDTHRLYFIIYLFIYSIIYLSAYLYAYLIIFISIAIF